MFWDYKQTNQPFQIRYVGLDIVHVICFYSFECLESWAARFTNRHGERDHPFYALIQITPLQPWKPHKKIRSTTGDFKTVSIIFAFQASNTQVLWVLKVLAQTKHPFCIWIGELKYTICFTTVCHFFNLISNRIFLCLFTNLSLNVHHSTFHTLFKEKRKNVTCHNTWNFYH